MRGKFGSNSYSKLKGAQKSPFEYVKMLKNAK